ncbi:trypsin-like serine protease [Saccharothrix sp. NPDC042600]|uniref:S1 family peptidase n=1 Tax=Saccharothrix sp. NPDC042600 TaxID=3154492 RepID=UPI00340AEB34
MTPYIIGGGTVSSAPWAAAVFQSGRFACSGTIISPEWVLTARHCLSSSMSVRVGSVYKSSGGTTAGVVRQVASSRSDFALLRLSRSVATTYVTLASADPAVDSTNAIYGWGRTSYDGPASEQLKTASVRVTSTSCSDYIGGRAICSVGIDGNAWKGDSGGPQMANGVQVGVASTADGRSRQTYGSVAANRSWIRAVTGV